MDFINNLFMVMFGSRKILLGEDMFNGIFFYFSYYGLGDLIFGEDGILLIFNGDGFINVGVDIGGDSLGMMVLLVLEVGIIIFD